MLLLAASYACSCFPMPLCLCWRPYRYSHWRPGQQQLCHGASASSIFPMLPHCLPCRVSRGAATLPHRLPLRSIPPPRFACGASHSRGTWASTVCAEEFPTPLEMSLHGLHLSTGLLLLRQTQICRPICTDCLRHLRISAR